MDPAGLSSQGWLYPTPAFVHFAAAELSNSWGLGREKAYLCTECMHAVHNYIIFNVHTQRLRCQTLDLSCAAPTEISLLNSWLSVAPFISPFWSWDVPVTRTLQCEGLCEMTQGEIWVGFYFWGKTWITLHKAWGPHTEQWGENTEQSWMRWGLRGENPVCDYGTQPNVRREPRQSFITAPLIPNACLCTLKGVPCL